MCEDDANLCFDNSCLCTHMGTPPPLLRIQKDICYNRVSFCHGRNKLMRLYLSGQMGAIIWTALNIKSKSIVSISSSFLFSSFLPPPPKLSPILLCMAGALGTEYGGFVNVGIGV